MYVQALEIYSAPLVLIPIATITVSDVCSEIVDSECLVFCSMMCHTVMLLIFFYSLYTYTGTSQTLLSLDLSVTPPQNPVVTFTHLSSLLVLHCHLLRKFVSSCALLIP